MGDRDRPLTAPVNLMPRLDISQESWQLRDFATLYSNLLALSRTRQLMRYHPPGLCQLGKRFAEKTTGVRARMPDDALDPGPLPNDSGRVPNKLVQ